MKSFIFCLFLILQFNHSHLMSLNNNLKDTYDLNYIASNEFNNENDNKLNYLTDDLLAEEDVSNFIYTTVSNIDLNSSYQQNKENNSINESKLNQVFKINSIDTIKNKNEPVTTPSTENINILNQTDLLKKSIKLNIENNTLESINQTSSNNQLNSFDKDVKLIKINNDKLNEKFKLDDIKLANQFNQKSSSKLDQQLNQMKILLDNETKKELKDNNRLRIVLDEISRDQVDNQSIEQMDKDEFEDYEEQINPQHETTNYNHLVSDLPLEQTNDSDQSVSIGTNYCKKDKCKSAILTDPNYYLVNCKSENLEYNCFYCQKNYLFIENRKICAGPCTNKDDCDKLLDKYEHVYCPSDYKEDDESSSLCIKEDKFKFDRRPFSQSFFYIKKWQSIKKFNDTVTLVHQINLNDFQDSNGEDACKFKLNINRLIDPKLDIKSTPFKLAKEDNTIKLFLKTPSTFTEAQLEIDCNYKQFTLHKSTLNFNINQ